MTRGAHAPAVVVVGAGSAGATVAWKLAAADHRVVLIDRAAREALGRPWINGVEERLFPDLGIRARPPIRFAERQRVIMQTPAGHRMSIEQPPVAEIDMRHLTDALLRNALLFGVRLRCRSEVRRLIVEGGAVHGVVVRGPEGGEENIAARCVVHAAGHRRIPGTEELGDQAPGGTIEEADLCVAHQQVHRIDDLEEARRFMTRQRLGPHDTLCRVGGRGGYSIANIGIDPAARRVSFLTGAMMTQGSGAAREMLQELRAELPFAGPVLLGGGGTIPVRRPHASLVAKGLALVGDAAAQVYPARQRSRRRGAGRAAPGAHLGRCAARRRSDRRAGLVALRGALHALAGRALRRFGDHAQALGVAHSARDRSTLRRRPGTPGNQRGGHGLSALPTLAAAAPGAARTFAGGRGVGSQGGPRSAAGRRPGAPSPALPGTFRSPRAGALGGPGRRARAFALSRGRRVCDTIPPGNDHRLSIEE